MAKIIHPLHSLSASGTIGRTLSFRATLGGAVATSKAKSYPQTSAAQLINQQAMRDARAAFLTLSVADKNKWHAVAVVRRSNTWATFFAEYQYQMIVAPAMPLIPEAIL
ncbi:MAG: hypothetical protein WC825_05995 [Gallionellaceae bacterium]|jgi:hypothetical protein